MGVINGSDPNVKKFNQISQFSSSETVGTVVKELWKNSNLRDVYCKNKYLQFHDNADYFFENLDRFYEKNFQATVHDILRLKHGVHSISYQWPQQFILLEKNNSQFVWEILCSLNKGIPLEIVAILFDYLCQVYQNSSFPGFEEAVCEIRSYRWRFLYPLQNCSSKKWLLKIQPTMVFYCVDISDFAPNPENGISNLRNLALLEFLDFIKIVEQIDPYMEIYLFFTKEDKFRQNLANGLNFKSCFPEYMGEDTDCEAAIKFLTSRFQELSLSNPLYSVSICLHDTTAVERMVSATQSTVTACGMSF